MGSGKRTVWQRGRKLPAIIAMLAMAVCGAGTASAADMTQTVADASTMNGYNADGTLGTASSTRYNGRVWTDKSVSTETVTFTNPYEGNSGQTATVAKGDSDFLVTYSALATSQNIGKYTVAPSDTVFILDLSASMTWGYGADDGDATTTQEKSRLQSMVDSVNTAIGDLVKANPDNRIAIVTFNKSAGAQQDLIGSLTRVGDLVSDNGDYLSITKWVTEEGDDTQANVQYNGKTVSTGSGTNIQAGLFRGMNILATNTDTKYDLGGSEIVRIPNVILMSDGAPTTFSSSNDAEAQLYVDSSHKNQCQSNYVTGAITDSTGVCSATNVESGSWWATSTGQAIGAGDNNNPDSADGFMALLTASYFKNKITHTYYGSDPGEQSASVYTVGFATAQGQNEWMSEMANIVLNPAEHLTEAANWTVASDAANNANNVAEIQQVGKAEAEYLANQSATLQGSIGTSGHDVGVAYTASHATDENDPTSLDYPTQYFYAGNSAELNDALTQIAKLITAKTVESPTETDDQNPTESGWITYTDPIGKYMSVDSVKQLIWNGVVFNVNAPSEKDNGDGSRTYTYTFDDTGSIDSPVYGEHSVNDIDVTVSIDQNGNETLTVRIPASAIPLRVNNITLDSDGTVTSNTSNQSLPLRLVYGVSLDDAVTDKDGILNAKSVADDYLSNNTKDGNVYFYSNLYTGQSTYNGTVGDATVTFVPAKNNPFYYMQSDTPVYGGGTYDEKQGVLTGGTVLQSAADIAADGTYYFPITYYEGTSERTWWVQVPGADLTENFDLKTDGSQLVIAAGSPRVDNFREFRRQKGSDATGTASYAYVPEFTRATSRAASGDSVTVHLGNNGRIAVPTSAKNGNSASTLPNTGAGVVGVTVAVIVCAAVALAILTIRRRAR